MVLIVRINEMDWLANYLILYYLYCEGTQAKILGESFQTNICEQLSTILSIVS